MRRQAGFKPIRTARIFPLCIPHLQAAPTSAFPPFQPSRKHSFYSLYSRRRPWVTAALCAFYSREEEGSLGDGDRVSSRRLELGLHGCGWS